MFARGYVQVHLINLDCKRRAINSNQQIDFNFRFTDQQKNLFSALGILTFPPRGGVYV